jgi:beta-glucosidase
MVRTIPSCRTGFVTWLEVVLQRQLHHAAAHGVVQLYVHQKVISVTRPVLELRGFQRIHLRPGEKTTVSFTLTPESLALWNEEMKPVVEPGEFAILVGTSSVQTQATQLKVTAK